MEGPPKSPWYAERRLGERRVVPPIPVVWRADAARRRLRRDGPDKGQVVNVSPIGAGIVAPYRPELTGGTKVAIVWAGASAEVEIRRTEGGPIPGLSYYGVRFGARGEDFDRIVDDTISACRPSSVEALRSDRD